MHHSGWLTIIGQEIKHMIYRLYRLGSGVMLKHKVVFLVQASKVLQMNLLQVAFKP